jgi:hypothetical protein
MYRLVLETIRKLSSSEDPKTRRKGERLLVEWRRKFPEAFSNSDGEANGGSDCQDAAKV